MVSAETVCPYPPGKFLFWECGMQETHGGSNRSELTDGIALQAYAAPPYQHDSWSGFEATGKVPIRACFLMIDCRTVSIMVNRLYNIRLGYFFTMPRVALRFCTGIPALLPGEGITQESLDILEAVKAGGGVVSGCSDPSLTTMRIVDNRFL